MAAPIESPDTTESEEETCFIHCNKHATGSLIAISDHNWGRILKFTEDWKHLSGIQAEIAKVIAARLTVEQNLETPPLCYTGFHRSCYSYYTHSGKLKNAEKAHEKQQQLQPEPVADVDTTSSEEDVPPRKKPLLRSSISSTTAQPEQRSKHVLPRTCIICNKAKYTRNKGSGSRRKEALTSCTSIDGDKLKKAAEDKGNERINMQLKGADCVALEVKYHSTCYRDFTRYLTKVNSKNDLDTSNSAAYDKFCDTVREKVIKNKEPQRLTKLNKLFIEQVKKIDGENILSYKTASLKRRLQQTFPQLCFVKPHQRNQSEIVYVNDDEAIDAIVEERQMLRETMSESSSEATSTDSEQQMPTRTGTASTLETSLRDMFMSALALKKDIDGIKVKLPWPPLSEHLSPEAAKMFVPIPLFNFLVWITGLSNDPQNEHYIHLTPQHQNRILSIAQDIVYLSSKGRIQTPKHLSLAMTLRHLSGSAQLIGLMNGLGHSVSHSATLEHDTAIARREMARGEDALPLGIEEGQHTILVYDNNDFGEETLSGRGTTHNTNGIIIQRKPPSVPDVPGPSSAQDQSSSSTTIKKTHERAIHPAPQHLETYYGTRKKEGPKPVGNEIVLSEQPHEKIQKFPRQIDFAYHVTRFACEEQKVPSWTGFNQLMTQVEVPPKSVIGYLPIIDASPTEMNTVLTILTRCVAITDKLNLQTVVVVMDQAIYSKAQIIRWKNAVFMKRLVIRLGAFHTVMSYMGCIGKRFRDAGLQDVLIEAEVVATGSINGVINGHHYNRSIRAHKLMAEAMQQLRFEAYLESVDEEEEEKARKLMEDLGNTSLSDAWHGVADSDQLNEALASYEEFIAEGSKNRTFRFWSSYIELVEVLLLFQRSIREGNWELHLSAVRSTLPWIFAYDHINYARYLPAYWLEMIQLPKTHPDIYQNHMNGEFTVQRSKNAFAQIACDLTIEQTANRDSKTKGGMVGFTNKKGAVNRWITTHHERAAITRQCEQMAGKNREESGSHADLQTSRIKKDIRDIRAIKDTVESMVNPFQHECDELVHISSGVVASSDVTRDIEHAKDKGEEAFCQFAKDRLQDGTVDFFKSISKLKLKTFTDMGKTTRTRVRGQDITLKSDRNLLARLVVIGKTRKVDLREMMTYCLGPLPAPIASREGCLVKTNKACLMHKLEDSCEEGEQSIPSGSIFVVDGMAMIQEINPKKLPGTRSFKDLSLFLCQRIVNMARSVSATAVHFVTDRYPSSSIKNAERKKRAASGSQRIRVYGQAVPQQWKKFLANGLNKEELTEYIYEVWKTYKGKDLKGVKVYLAHGDKCHAFTPKENMDDVVEVKEVSELQCNHEEADTRLWLHAAYEANARDDPSSSSVVIKSPDTDVFVIGVTIAEKLSGQIFFHTGKGDDVRTLNMKKIHQSIGKEGAEAMIGLHCFTGCDSVSAFYGKGKKKALALMLKEEQFCTAFQKLGEAYEVSDEMLVLLEKFVCQLYGQKKCTEVNKARHDMFCFSTKSETAMPPNRDSLIKHIARANYQAAVHRKSLEQMPEHPSPLDHGWQMEDGELSIQWTTLPPAPESVLEFVHCTGRCNRSNCSDASKCSCLENNIPCTDLCKCNRERCGNVGGQQENADDDSDDSSDDDEVSDVEHDDEVED